jgi:hypothetical protein
VQLPGWPVGGAGAGAAPTAATQTLGFDPLLRLTQNRLGAGGITSSASSYAQIYQSTYQYDRASNVRTLQSEDSSASAKQLGLSTPLAMSSLFVKNSTLPRIEPG